MNRKVRRQQQEEARYRDQIETAIVPWLKGRGGADLPSPAMIEDAAAILAAPVAERDMSLHVSPATVWRVNGHMVIIFDGGHSSGLITRGECSCPAPGMCKHLLCVLTHSEAQLQKEK